ncbi:hypothetical protein JVU11DRAFT_12973 [Chiua virens]|nr:hypothetical protein JVU11DRAFT_12973 [Chiua virens]
MEEKLVFMNFGLGLNTSTFRKTLFNSNQHLSNLLQRSSLFCPTLTRNGASPQNLSCLPNPHSHSCHRCFSASIPAVASATLAASIISSAIATPNPHAELPSLLSTRDPLSVPIMTTNFRRFVSKVGPVFWLQDRIEEIILWKKGWKRTTAFLAAYGFLSHFPRMALLVPHVVLLGVMLHLYPNPGAQPVPINVGEGTADWQANIQAIQNLMGVVSDAHDAVVPLLPFLVAPHMPHPSTSPPKSQSIFSSISTSSPVPIQKSPRSASDAPSLSNAQSTTQPHHPLLIVTLSFFILLPILATDLFPLRFLFFLAGTGSVVALHPYIRDPLSSIILQTFSGTGPGLSLKLAISLPHLPNSFSLLPFPTYITPHPSPSRTHTFTLTFTPRDVYLSLRRLIDDDRLEDTVWRAPVAHVELWENERWVQDAGERKRRKSTLPVVLEGENGESLGGEDDAASTTSTGTVTGPGDAKGTMVGGTWSKGNLKPNERVGWTRGRDGWYGVGGEVSNLTFSLSPGWAFVESESWRPDLNGSWVVEGSAPYTSVCVGADQDGWTYTTDTWTYPRPGVRPADGWVTRRRRWVRRVYFKGVER